MGAFVERLDVRVFVVKLDPVVVDVASFGSTGERRELANGLVEAGHVQQTTTGAPATDLLEQAGAGSQRTAGGGVVAGLEDRVRDRRVHALVGVVVHGHRVLATDLRRQGQETDEFGQHIAAVFVVQKGHEALGTFVDFHPVALLIDSGNVRHVFQYVEVDERASLKHFGA